MFIKENAEKQIILKACVFNFIRCHAAFVKKLYSDRLSFGTQKLFFTSNIVVKNSFFYCNKI